MLVSTNLSFILGNCDEEEKVGDESFFGELVKNITKITKNALTDQDCQKTMKKKFDSSDKNKVLKIVRNGEEKPISRFEVRTYW